MNALATILLIPQLLSVSAGQSFTLTLLAQAATTTGTVVAKVAYDPTLLSADRFDLAAPWVAVEKRGYISIDNARGMLIETAGYPGGLIGTTTLGSITFKAKAGGRATIVIAGASIVLDAQNRNQFGGRAGAAVITIAGQPPREQAPAGVGLGAPPPAALLPSLPAAAALAPHDWLRSLLGTLGRRLHF